ncbi:hypothetical protein L1987_01407 [Smallanthus sonchifolius]|uniref:Uncharacterized protein n=1 Tax=Smallanthus sonchifolius TaxID=185202 RepID=A0ACB9K4Z5_9ASTR|nr:hypothetical protein L1987_01407 [Smallanthus sonchifolius]
MIISSSPTTPPQTHPSLHLLSKCTTMEQLKPIHAHIIKTGLHNPPDQIIWNTIIRAYSLTPSPFPAINFYKLMLSSDVKSNPYTFPALFKSCARIDGLNEGKQSHGHVLKLGLCCDAFIHTSLISFYAQVGGLDDARLVFDESPLRDAVSFTAFCFVYCVLFRLLRSNKRSIPNDDISKAYRDFF